MKNKLWALILIAILLVSSVANGIVVDEDTMNVGDPDYEINMAKMSVWNKFVYSLSKSAQTVIDGASCSPYPDRSTDYLDLSKGTKISYTNSQHVGVAFQVFLMDPWTPLASSPVELSNGESYTFTTPQAGDYRVEMWYCDSTSTRSCFDSDATDYYNKGYVRITIGGNSDTYYDKCDTDNKHLSERYCDSDNSLRSLYYDCPNGCENGACKDTPDEPETETCDGHATGTKWCYDANTIGSCSSTAVFTKTDCSPMICDSVTKSCITEGTTPTGDGARGDVCITNDGCDGQLVCKLVGSVTKRCLDLTLDSCTITCSDTGGVFGAKGECKQTDCHAHNCFVTKSLFSSALGYTNAEGCVNCISGGLNADLEANPSTGGCCSGTVVGETCTYATTDSVTVKDDVKIKKGMVAPISLSDLDGMTTGDLFEHGCAFSDDCLDGTCKNFDWLKENDYMTAATETHFYDTTGPAIRQTIFPALVGGLTGASAGAIACGGITALAGVASGGVLVLPTATICAVSISAGAIGGTVIGGTAGYGAYDYARSLEERDSSTTGICVDIDSDGDKLDICALDFMGDVKGLESYSCIASIGLILVGIAIFARVVGG